ncbi:uncharacterized protein [Parasteatoda tepidariorum]|uniref:uncharacterized protein n=1 Tax=Parasteatoda tepidariorum TaxID=114398 RepID=UPI00077F8B25|nr:uncharacterized protein LOC107445426 [Parasteatoda tepidariorum]
MTKRCNTNKRTETEPPALAPESSYPEIYSFSPIYSEWYFWIITISVICTIVALIFLCLLCWRKPYKTAVVRLPENLTSHYPGTILSSENIIQPDVAFYTQVHPCPETIINSRYFRNEQELERLPTPCRPLEPAYQPTQLLTITTVRLPYLTSDLALPPGYVSLHEGK